MVKARNGCGTLARVRLYHFRFDLGLVNIIFLRNTRISPPPFTSKDNPKTTILNSSKGLPGGLIHGSMWKREDKEASWRERITCGHQSPGTAGTGQFPGRELSSKGPSSNLEPKKKKKAA